MIYQTLLSPGFTECLSATDTHQGIKLAAIKLCIVYSEDVTSDLLKESILFKMFVELENFEKLNCSVFVHQRKQFCLHILQSFNCC